MSGGRPINQDRQLAISLGFKTYHGTPHDPCGTTERYTKGAGCVHCARQIATEQREARAFLKASKSPLDKPEVMVAKDENAAERFRQDLDDLM